MLLLRKTAAGLLILALCAGSASAACSYDTDPFQNCLDATDDALPDVFQNNDTDYEAVHDRVESVGDAVKECMNCATDTIEEDIKQM